MPRELEPLPEEKSTGKKFVAHEILKNTPSETVERATFAEYTAMCQDRPEKFSEEDVNYRKAEDPGNECEHCAHMYRQVAGEKRATCEILRPNGDASIEDEWVCDFMTRDFENYPYQKSSSRSASGEDEKGG